MKLYFAPGACSLSPHVTLRELGVPFELERVDLRAKTTASGESFLAINPKGYVPALRLDDGRVLTEGAIMAQYLADQHPDKHLAPPAGTPARYLLQERMHFLATELHKGMSPLYNPKANDEFKQALVERLQQRMSILAKLLEDQSYVMGEAFSVADPYALYVLRAWRSATKRDLSAWPALAAYEQRLNERPSVKAALEAESPKA